MELTDFSKYQMDFLYFKNEVLKLLSKHEENFKKKENEDKNKYEDISKAQEEQINRFSKRITELYNTRYVEQAKLDKIDTMSQKLEALTENVSINTIRLATCQKELSNAIYKYDKIFIENLTVPGLVGNYCKHKTLRDFIQFGQDNITNLLQSKGRNESSLQVYKDNIDVLLRQFSLKFDSILKQAFGYTKDAFTECTDNYKISVQEVYDKMDSVRLENIEHAITLKNRNNEFSKDLEIIKGVKVDLFNKMSNTLVAIEQKNKEFTEKYDYMKNTFKNITGELNKHSSFIEGFNQIINQLKGGSNKNRSIDNYFKDRKFSRDKDKDRDEYNQSQEMRIDNENLKDRVIEIIKEYYSNGAYNKELNGKKTDFKKNGIIEVESNLKKYIKGEITSAEFSPNQKRRGSSFVNLVKKAKSNQGSPKLNEDYSQTNNNIPNLKLEEEKDNNNNLSKHHKENQSMSNSNSELESSSINGSMINLNIIKPLYYSNGKDNKAKIQTQNNKGEKTKGNSSNSNATIKRKKLSIAISSRDELIPKMKSTAQQNDDKDNNKDQDQVYGNILNWKINEKMKNKVMAKEAKEKTKIEKGSQDISKETSKKYISHTISTTNKDKIKDYFSRYNNNDSKNDMNTIQEYENSTNDNKTKQKGKSKDGVKEINIKSTILKKQELCINPSNVFNKDKDKNKREIWQESTNSNFHYPHIESVSTPHHINTSKSESKYFLNKNYNTNMKKPKCQSAKKEDMKMYDRKQIKSSFHLSKEQIERKLIEMEYYTKKKFDELVSELQKYIPLNFKSHTRYCINDIEEAVTQRKNKSPNEIEYENDLKQAKISIVNSEVLEKVSDNCAFRSLFPKKSPKYQGSDKKGLSSFRKLQQGGKDKDKEKEKEKEKKVYNKTQLFGGNSNTNNNNFGYNTNYPANTNHNKEINLSEASSYVSLNKLFTNIPKSSSNPDDKHNLFPFDNN